MFNYKMGRNSWYSSQSTQDQQAPSSAAPAAVAGAIAPAHNGVADPNVAPSIPKYNQIVPQSVPVNACWGGSQQQVDVIIDRSIGKALNYFVEFDVTFTNSANTAGKAFLASAASLIDRYDILYNGSVIETVYADNLFYEGMVLKTDQELAQHAPIWGIDFNTSTGYPQPAEIDVSGAITTAQYSYYVPLVGVVPSAQLFVAGVKGELRYRFYLADNPLCGKAGYTGAFQTTSTVTINLKNMTLWVEEASLSDETFNALLKQHKHGINYRSVLRTLWQKTQPTITAGNTQTDILNAFSNDSAGLLVYVTNNSLDNAYFMERIPLKNLQLLDAGGATLTRVLPSALVENSITPAVTPVAASFVNNPNFTTYIFPFCSSLERVLNCGSQPKGGLKLSAQEQLSINVNSNQAGVLENVISFDYCAMRVQKGELKWARTAGDLPGWSANDY